ncbi:hypothetical protein F5883DRAFT_500733 [Diaporthe sp. PMI_573]|nr:hypothetical protein F5883DRAFT_500733 [Diaporthaceae sp. PMI_573]
MSFNVKAQNQHRQAASDKKARRSSRAGCIDFTVKQRRPRRYPPEFWDRLSRISLTHTALEELDQRNKGHDQPCSLWPPTTPAQSQGLFRFSRGGGPCLCHLRGYQPAQSTDPTNATTRHKTTILSTHASNFERHLTKNNIHPVWQSREPDLESIYEALAAPRLSLLLPEFSTESFQTFRKNNQQAMNERDIIDDVIPIIVGVRSENWPVARDIIFNDLEALTDGSIPSAKPDYAYGALFGQLIPAICIKLGRFIDPELDIPLIVPNFFLEVKGPNGSAAVKTRQARYDGAIGARAMHHLQNYGQEEPIYDGKAYTFSATYQDGQLMLYAHHLTAPTTRGGQPEYHMTQLDAWATTGNIQSFIAGVTAFRNLRDLAKQHRDTFIQDANFRHQQA